MGNVHIHWKTILSLYDYTKDLQTKLCLSYWWLKCAYIFAFSNIKISRAKKQFKHDFVKLFILHKMLLPPLYFFLFCIYVYSLIWTFILSSTLFKLIQIRPPNKDSLNHRHHHTTPKNKQKVTDCSVYFWLTTSLLSFSWWCWCLSLSPHVSFIPQISFASNTRWNI